MNLPKHINILMASVVTFSVAISPIEISVAYAQSAPAAEAPGDSGWQKEFELWRTSNKGGKPADYQKYLRVYPNGKFANVAKRRIEELNAATQTAVPADETAAVNDVSKNVPADNAQSTADAAKDVELWRQVSKTGKQADYEKYLKQFPNGKFAKVAKTRIENLVAKANAPAEESVEVTSKKVEPAQDDQAEDQQAEAQDQADTQPDAQDQAQTDAADDNAATETAQTEEKPAAGADWEQEYALWKAASDGNTVNEYEAYLRAYPNGKFAAIAQARVVQLTAAEQPDPTIAEGDDTQNDATNKANVAGNRKNNKQQPDDQAAEDDQSQPADDQAQDTANTQDDDSAAADRQNSMAKKQGGLTQQPDQAQNQDQQQQQAQYTEGSEDIEASVLDREQRHEMQGRLSALGYDTQGTDGSFGPRTRDAIASWQQDNGAPVTGYLSEDQIDGIRVASAASYATWLATAAPVVIRRVRPRTEWVVVRPRVVVRRPAAVVVVKPFRNRARYNNRVKVKIRFNGGCRKRRRC
ncbi:peptidoglycan-binding protein [Rhizobium sp. TH2]|uniref:peptidoglycan-binding protein n=1 Tax=Rhizobium sp. TH2 TaxID=2775403 RepID=UPI0021586742|nr:peptidoglycan-binding protein [Rhizobium sp. TH2]